MSAGRKVENNEGVKDMIDKVVMLEVNLWKGMLANKIWAKG